MTCALTSSRASASFAPLRARERTRATRRGATIAVRASSGEGKRAAALATIAVRALPSISTRPRRRRRRPRDARDPPLRPRFRRSRTFIVRIVMTWYPSVPYTKLPWVIAYVPTEPLLKPTRALVPPVGGVDVSPIIWVGMISFMNEILLGKQGLLVLLSNQGTF